MVRHVYDLRLAKRISDWQSATTVLPLVQCLVSAARSLALGKADVVVLVGCRLNWMFHYGEAPRWSKDVKIIQLEIEASELNHNKESALTLLGDCKRTLAAINQCLSTVTVCHCT
jgi:thiamine pyrophosphate-dependent acetolactate synthase large subunit-like protein